MLAILRDAFSEINILYKVTVLDWMSIRAMLMKMIRMEKIAIPRDFYQGH